MKKTLMTSPLGKSEFVSPQPSMFPDVRVSGKLTCNSLFL